MGLAELRELIEPEETDLKALAGREIAIDAFNAMYQFLTTIMKDGRPLMDSRGRITSHLNGLLYRTVNLVEEGIKPVYVFDGEPPNLKRETLERRRERKEEAMEKLKRARTKEEREKYARQVARLDESLVEDAKRLLDLMGIPWVQAPSEGEAQCAYMARCGDVWAAGSQDYDSMLFGSPRLVRNITIVGKRRHPHTGEIVEVKPEIIRLEDVLKRLGLESREQLVDLAILLGTDYNPDGVPGIGPKRALQLIRKYGSLDELKDTDIWPKIERHLPVEPEELRRLFLEPEVIDDYELNWDEPDEERLVEFLVEERDFSEDRVRRAVERLKEALQELRKGGRQETLDTFL
ncbi:flap endonuclease-1 [Methanopyrus sp.]